MNCKSLRQSVRVVVLLGDLPTHTHALTLERMQTDANRRAPIKSRLRTHLMSFWTKFQLSIYVSIINDVIKPAAKRGHLASASCSTHLRSYSNTFKLNKHRKMNELALTLIFHPIKSLRSRLDSYLYLDKASFVCFFI